MELFVPIILGLAVGALFGLLRFRRGSTDIILLGIWVVLLAVKPTIFLAFALIGYLIGWCWRVYKKRTCGDDQKGDGNSQ